jgi:hypothetical protein
VALTIAATLRVSSLCAKTWLRMAVNTPDSAVPATTGACLFTVFSKHNAIARLKWVCVLSNYAARGRTANKWVYLLTCEQRVTISRS